VSNLKIKLWDYRDTGKVEALCDTLKTVFPQSGYSAELFLWKHIHNPWGPSIVTYAEESATGKYGAVRAFWRHQICYNNKILLAFQPCDTATHPDFRKQGLFTKLTQLALDEAREQKASFVFNFPNPQSKPGYIKMGWHDMGKVITLIKPLNYKRIVKHLFSNRGKPGNFVPLKKISSLGQDSDDETLGQLHLRNTMAEAKTIYGSRDREMLYWRFFRHPENAYELINCGSCSAIVNLGIRGHLRELLIMELFFQGTKSYGMQLRDLCAFVKKTYSVDMITVLFTKNHPFLESFRDNGFYCVPNHINFVALGLAESLNVSESRWALTACDLDTF